MFDLLFCSFILDTISQIDFCEILMIKKTILRFINNLKEYFVELNAFGKLGVVFTISAAIVFPSSLFLGSIKETYNIFIDPPALFTYHESTLKFLFSLFLMVAGIIILSFVVSVLTTSLEKMLYNIRMGKLDFVGENHTIIINFNDDIFTILRELDTIKSGLEKPHEIVLIIDNESKIQHLIEKIKAKNYTNLKIHLRYGELTSIKRYKELSLLEAQAVVILENEEIDDPFVQDNLNLKIINTLYRDPEFQAVLNQKRDVEKRPVKLVGVFTQTHHFQMIVDKLTDKHFLAIAPKDILSNLLYISMVEIEYYKIWSLLLSSQEYKFFFVDPNTLGIVGEKYKDILLRHKEGLLLGLSEVKGNSYKDVSIYLNPLHATINANSWPIFLARSQQEISLEATPLQFEDIPCATEMIASKSKKALIIGTYQTLNHDKLIQDEHLTISHVNPDEELLFQEDYFEHFFAQYDTIILNLYDELSYRIAMFLDATYPQEICQKIVILIEDRTIAKQLQQLQTFNILVSNELVSKYIVKIANQITLHKVFQKLFVLKHVVIDIFDLNDCDTHCQSDIAHLQYYLVQNHMSYLGIITKEGKIILEAKTLKNAKKVIVLQTKK